MKTKFWEKERRRIYYIKKDFQRRFILRYIILLISGALIANIILYSLSRDIIADTLYSAHITIKNTGEVLLYPLLITAAVVIIAATISVTLVSLVSNRLLDSQLRKLFVAVREFGSGNFGVRLEANHKGEFNDLFIIFNNTTKRMGDKIAFLKKEINEIELEISKKDGKGEVKSSELLEKVDKLIKLS